VVKGRRSSSASAEHFPSAQADLSSGHTRFSSRLSLRHACRRAPKLLRVAATCPPCIHFFLTAHSHRPAARSLGHLLQVRKHAVLDPLPVAGLVSLHLRVEYKAAKVREAVHKVVEVRDVVGDVPHACRIMQSAFVGSGVSRASVDNRFCAQ